MIMAMIVPGRYHGDPIRDSAKREVPHISGEQKSYIHHPHIMPFSKKPQYGKRVKTRLSKDECSTGHKQSSSVYSSF